MNPVQLISFIITLVILTSFCVVFTLIFRYYYGRNISDVKLGNYDTDIIELGIKESQKKKKKAFKTFKIIINVISYSLIGILLVSFTFSLIGKINGDALQFGNYGLIAISSGSMSKKNEANTYLFENNLNNQIQTYDLISIEKVKSKDELKLYDIICFESDKGDKIIHRIIEINSLGYITRGDSNKNSDVNALYKGYLTFDKVLGKYTGTKIPVAGMFVIFLQSTSGTLTLISLIYCLFMFDVFKSKYELEIEKRNKYLFDLFGISKDNLSDIELKTIDYSSYQYVYQNNSLIEKKEITNSEDNLMTLTLLINKEEVVISKVIEKENVNQQGKRGVTHEN